MWNRTAKKIGAANSVPRLQFCGFGFLIRLVTGGAALVHKRCPEPPKSGKNMKQHHSSSGALLTFLALSAGLLATLAAEDHEAAKVETRAYALGGYIPKFYEVPVQRDPFDEKEAAEHREKLKKYEQGIVSYLEQHGIKAREVEFMPQFNALFLTDTPENLAMHEVLLRSLFRPDMQVRAIEETTKALADRTILEGDQLSQIGLLDEITFRAFHGEVRKLESEMEYLPKEHQERKVIAERIRIAKEYREEAIKLYLKSLEEQKALIARWQEAAGKTAKDGAVQPAAAPESKSEGNSKPQPDPEGRSR
jgi:hypothetical protein